MSETKKPIVQGDKCPKCGSYGEARSSEFGEFNGSRKFRCSNITCKCVWETLYALEVTTQLIDE